MCLGDGMSKEEDYLCLEECLRCPNIFDCSPKSLQAAMQLVNIQMLAFTPPNTLPWRVYLYTHTQQSNSVADTPHSSSGRDVQHTLILGELQYSGKGNKKHAIKGSISDGEVVTKDWDDEREEEEEKVVAYGLRTDRTQDEVKVTLKQHPKDEQVLKGFISILRTLLHTLSSEGV